MKPRLALLLLLSTCECRVAIAQAGNNSYATPGMPTLLQRGLPVNTPAKIKPWLTEQLPRFWHTADLVIQQQEARKCLMALRQRIRYPAIALEHQIAAEMVVSVQLMPSGGPRQVLVRKALFRPLNPAPEIVIALKAEAIRVAQLLRFQARADTPESLVFPLKFIYD